MKQRLKNWLLKSVLGAVVIDDVVTEDKGSLRIGGKLVTETELRSLVNEIKAIENTRLWNLLNETVKSKSFERGWNKSTSLEELNTAKTMYSTLELQQSIIKLIKKQKI